MRTLFLTVILACTASMLAFAAPNDTKGKAETRNVTGCLSQGSDANQFVLTAADGSKWKLESDSVALGDHVGHTISATGAVDHATMHNMKEEAKDMAQDSGMKKDNTESGTLKVTKVKMVSDSCKQ
jgi:hypothetical protein